MRPGIHCSLAALLIVSATVQAESLLVQRQPTVVYEGRNTIPAHPYYRRLKRKDAAGTRVAVPDGVGVRPLEQRLPLSSTRLAPGPPGVHTAAGLFTPIFVMGMDEASLTWFALAAAGLADIGARGVVVQANRLDHWRALQQQARTIGIELMLMQGDSLAQGYGIRTYPVVLMSPALAQKGMHE